MRNKFTLLLIVLLGLSIELNIFQFRFSRNNKNDIPDMDIETSYDNTISDWDTFILALAWVESKWDTEVVGLADDVGYLQITPVLVKDANRIVGYDKYSLSDRTDMYKSIEIYNVIMDNYNPQHDMQLALKIWNPYAKVSYHRAVMDKYEELTSNQQILL